MTSGWATIQTTIWATACITGRNTIAALLLLCATIPASQAADQAQQQRQQIKQLSAESKKLTGLLKEFKNQRSTLQSQLQQSETAIGSLQKKTRDILGQLLQEQTELRRLQSRRDSLNDKKQHQQQLLGQQLIAAYQVGKQRKLKVLLNQEQPDKIARALTYYDYFNRARNEQITAFTAVVEELNTLEVDIQSRRRGLELTKSRLDSEQQALQAKQKQRAISLANIDTSISNNDLRLRQLAKDRSELERLLAAVEKSLANITNDYQPFDQLRGKLPWPVAGKLSHRFGSRRSSSSQRWQGVKILAAAGSEVQSIHHGRIVFADWFRGSGLLIIIDHGDGYMSLYAHNQSILRETGEWIGAGETIATVGNSGGQSRASLYFEIRHNGKPANPAKWCKRS